MVAPFAVRGPACAIAVRSLNAAIRAADLCLGALTVLRCPLLGELDPLGVAPRSGRVARSEPRLRHTAPVGGEETCDGPSPTLDSREQ